MTRMWRFAVTAVVLGCFATSPSNAQNTQRGAVWGGLAGAAAGALIGDHNDEAGAGAAIGGAVGLIAGSVLGNAADVENARSHAAYQQYQYQYQYQQVQRAVSLQDVIAMRQSGVSDAVIISTINHHGIQRPLEVSDVVYLSQSGVSDAVIQTLQRGAVGGTVVASQPVYARPYASPSTRVYIARPYPVYVPQYGHGPHRRCW